MAVGRCKAEARHAVLAAREKLAQLEAEHAATSAELDSLQARAGEEVLDDPTAAPRLTRALGELRDRLEITSRAIEAQRPRVLTAERAYLATEAQRLREPVREIEERLAKHQRRTDELLALLADHEGQFVPKAELVRARPMSSATTLVIRDDGTEDDDGPIGLVSEEIKYELAIAGKRVWIVETLAAGQDPQPALQAEASIIDGYVLGLPIRELYPACVSGPDALVPAPQYLRSLEALRQRVAELEHVAATLPDEVREWERREEEEFEGRLSKRDGLAVRQTRLNTIGADLEQARADLAGLTADREV